MRNHLRNRIIEIIRFTNRVDRSGVRIYGSDEAADKIMGVINMSKDSLQSQSCLDAAAAIEVVAQELDVIGQEVSAKMLRNAIDVILNVSTEGKILLPIPRPTRSQPPR